MPIERFFYSGNLLENQTIDLDEAQTHHVKVMRLQKGSSAELINGKGILAKATLASLEKKAASLYVEQILALEPPPQQEIILAQALPKINRLDFIVEKSVELGMTKLLLFDGERSEKKGLSEQQRQRIEQQFIAATKQCGRLYLPTLYFMPPLLEWTRKDNNIWLFGDLRPEAPKIDELFKEKKASSITAFIGPEAGFSGDEIKFLIDQEALGVKLHQNILRTDTAAIAMLALLANLT